ncbi:hypothetical protein Droror1_Dr00024104 [Drosera rotundifolia]
MGRRILNEALRTIVNVERRNKGVVELRSPPSCALSSTSLKLEEPRTGFEQNSTATIKLNTALKLTQIPESNSNPTNSMKLQSSQLHKLTSFKPPGLQHELHNFDTRTHTLQQMRHHKPELKSHT